MTDETKIKHPLDKLKALADIDLEIDKSRLDQESMRTPKLHNKWLRMLYERKEVLLSLEQKKKEVIRDTWLYYKGKADDEAYERKGNFKLNVIKNDLSMFIEADEDIHKIDFKIARVKAEMEFIAKTLEEINRRSWHISNTIKYLKFIHGEIA